MESHAHKNGVKGHQAAVPRIHFEETAAHPKHIEGSGVQGIRPPIHIEGNQTAAHPIQMEGFHAAVPLIHFEGNHAAAHPIHMEGVQGIRPPIHVEDGHHIAVHPIHFEEHHSAAPPIHIEGNHSAAHPIHIEGNHSAAHPIHIEGNHSAAHPIHIEGNHSAAHPIHIEGNHSAAHPIHIEGNHSAAHPIHIEGNHSAAHPIHMEDNINLTPGVPVIPPVHVPVANVLTAYMRKGLDVVAQNEGFVNYIVHDEKGSNVGDGFVGIMFKVHIQEINSDKHLTVMLKAPPANLIRRTEFGTLRLFKREVLMYTKVLPAFVAFQNEKHIRKANGFFNFPKCYFAEFDEELQDSVIIMEDLKESGYAMWSKFVPTNFEHARFVMESLGRLHAVSFAMKAQRPDIFDEFKELEDFMSDMQNDGFDQMMNVAMENAIAALPENTTNIKIRMQKLQSNFKQTMKELVKPELAEPFAVIGHGDCWINNFMFQYRRKRPEGIVLLDWQIARYCSPVLDLMYFIFVCTDSAMRARHYDELLAIYHRSLKDLLDHLGGDTTSQFPFTAFLRQLRSFGKFGITMGVFLIPMLTTKNEDLPDMDALAEKYVENDPSAMEGFMMQTTANGKSRLNGAIADTVKYGYL